MNKKEAIESFQQAIDSHKVQMAKIERLIYGQKVENPTPVSKVKCDFGKWLYGGDCHVQEILGDQFYERLDKQHEQWHIEYLKIYNIFFKDTKKNFFSKLISSNELDSLEYDKAKLYYLELMETTNTLLASFAASQRRISALNESKFKY